VNTEYPERHSLFAAILNVQDIPGLDGNTFFMDFAIMVEIDIRQHADAAPDRDLFIARLWSSNSVLVTLPGWFFSLVNNRDQIALDAPKSVINGLDDALHKYQDPDKTFQRENNCCSLRIMCYSAASRRF
jgi:hypothetical protein